MKSNKSIDLNNAQMKNVGTPTDSKDAATKAYVDISVANGGGSGEGGGTELVSYEIQIEGLDDYPEEFPTTSENIVDATETGKSLLKVEGAEGIKTIAGLDQVDNTSDQAKPVSDATQAALNLKVNSDNPAFTGAITGIGKEAVGLDQVNNTADIDKPVSTLTQEALDTKADYYTGLTVASFRDGTGQWPSVRPVDRDDMTVLCVGQTPGPNWMRNKDVLLDLSNINNNIYLMPSDTLELSDTLLIKG